MEAGGGGGGWGAGRVAPRINEIFLNKESGK